MKLKRFFSLFLAAAVLTCALAACGTPGNSSSGTQPPSSTPTTPTTPTAVPRFKMDKTDISLYKYGESFQLTVSNVPQGAAVEWKSENEDMATVTQDGTVTAVAPGIVRVFAECGGERVECTVRCHFEVLPGEGDNPPVQPDPEPTEKLTLDRSDFSLFKAGDSYRLTPSGMEEGALLLWASSDEAVATVADDGTVTAVGPGSATISVSAALNPGLTATCIVRCKLTETPATGGDTSTSGSGGPSDARVDLQAFYDTISASYEFGRLSLSTDKLLDGLYPGMTEVDTEQCLVYSTQMSMNMGEFGLVQVKDAKDVDTVKAIFQARIDYMAGDGNGPGGACYPAPTEQWRNNARVVSNGNYVMMVVHESCDDIVNAFNALF